MLSLKMSLAASSESALAVLTNRKKWHDRSLMDNESRKDYASDLQKCYDLAYPAPPKPQSLAAYAHEDQKLEHCRAMGAYNSFVVHRESVLVSRFMNELPTEERRFLLLTDGVLNWKLDNVVQLLDTRKPPFDVNLQSKEKLVECKEETDRNHGDLSAPYSATVPKGSAYEGAGSQLKEEKRDSNVIEVADEGVKKFLKTSISKVCAALIYGDESSEIFNTDEDVFKLDCQKMGEALVDPKVASASRKNILVDPAKKASETLTRFIVQFEHNIIQNACKAIKKKKENDIGMFAEEVVNKVVLETYVHCRKWHAFSVIAEIEKRRLSGDSPTLQYISRILEFAMKRWKNWYYKEMPHEKKMELLFAMKDLHSETLDSKFPELSSIKKSEVEDIKESPYDANSAMKHTDRFFGVFLLASGVSKAPKDATVVFVKEVCDALNASDLRHKDLAALVRTSIQELKPLSDRTFWFHYSGHYASDGMQEYRQLPLLTEMLEAVGRLVSNCVVTLHCCYANDFLRIPKFNILSNIAYSGFTVLACCSSDEVTALTGGFTELIIQGLRSAVKRCSVTEFKSTQDRCRPCHDHRQCTRNKGFVYITDLFDYVQAHHQREYQQVPTYSSSGRTVQLPVANYQDDSPINIALLVATSTEIYDDHIDLNKLPKSLEKLRKLVLLRVFELVMRTRKGAEEVAKAFACPVTKCSESSHANTEEEKRVSSWIRCIILAYRQFISGSNSAQADSSADEIKSILKKMKKISVVSQDVDGNQPITTIEDLQLVLKARPTVYYTVSLPGHVRFSVFDID